MSLVLAHISDLHVSRFGEHVSSLRSRRLHGQAAKPIKNGAPWEPLENVDGWRIERRARELRLVDELGTVHQRRKLDSSGEDKLRRELAALVRERLRTEHGRLAAQLPSPADVERLLDGDPGNTNLLFCRAAHQLLEDRPDWILITGDVTDDGVGYDLVLAALAPYVERGRVLAIPGNHDIYDSPPIVVPAHARKGRREKRELWAAFARALELPGEGAWLRELDGALVCGFDTCVPARTPFSASGAIADESLDALETALESAAPGACRVAMLHHHVVNLPFRAVGLAPWQLGMRLRNARAVYDFFQRHEFRAVLNGHRHVGYRYHPNHAPMFVSAPSATLGCRSGSAPRPFYWRIEIADREIASVRERLL